MRDEVPTVPTCVVTSGLSTRLTLPSTAMAVRQALQLLLQSAPISRLPAATLCATEIVFAEVLNNIVEHAYATHIGPILVTVICGDGSVDCEVQDQGLPMPGLSPPFGQIPNRGVMHDLPEGGFGWHLIRTLAKDLTLHTD